MRSVTPWEEYGQPNPAADAHLKEHIWRAGDTLYGLAFLYYGDQSKWRRIALRNGITDPNPKAIEPGTRLLIPPAPVEYGSFESA